MPTTRKIKWEAYKPQYERKVKQMARRSIWKGAITFGMVAIPTKLYSATEDARISLYQYHRECGSRISMSKYCSHCELLQMQMPSDATLPHHHEL